MLKYVSFVTKNNDVPFIVKRLVLEAALMSSLMYGCESWLCADVKPVLKLYNWSIKQLLGVRRTTSNLVCYAELGYPSLPDFFRFKHHRFFQRMWAERSAMQDDPLSLAIKIVKDSNTHTGKFVKTLITSECPSMTSLTTKVHAQIDDSESSRCLIYKEINPSFNVQAGPH